MEDAFARFQADLAGMGQGPGHLPPPPGGPPGRMPPPMGMPPPGMGMGGPPPPMGMGMGMPPPMGGPPDFMMPPPGGGPYGMPPPGPGGYYQPPPGPPGPGGGSLPYGTIASIRAGQGLGGASGAHHDPDHGVPPQPKGHGVPPTEKQQKKGALREAGGKRWRDPTLDEWPENDYRIFVGDLGNDVNDDSLAKAFQKYPSFAKAKIVKDKHTKKSKGFGFVSFLDSTDYAKALKEMNGKYVGNRPIKLRKSTWDERSAQVPQHKKQKKAPKQQQ